jgi:hypothetical protein
VIPMTQHDLEVLKQELELARLQGAEGCRLLNVWLPVDGLQWLVEEALKNATGEARLEREHRDGESFNAGLVEGYNDAIAIVRGRNDAINKKALLTELEEAKKEAREG